MQGVERPCVDSVYMVVYAADHGVVAEGVSSFPQAVTVDSAEPGHRVVLEALQAQPLLDLGMRLGEGSGAAVAVPLLRLACALHNNMATFTEAQVSEKL